MTCFSAVLISHFSVPFIQLHRAVADLPWCCKSPLPHWLRKVLSVKDSLQSWSPLAKQVVDLCNDLPGILVGLGQGKNLTTCSPFPALCSIWEVMLPSSFFPRVWWFVFFFPLPLHALFALKPLIPIPGIQHRLFLGMWQASCGRDNSGRSVPTATRLLHWLD